MQRILVIDDDAQIRAMLKEILELEGYEVDEAGNGREAIAIQQIRPSNLVIIDLLMPEQDGMETIMELTQSYPAVNIIAISGGGRIGPRDYLEMATALGAKKTFYKPFKRQEILAAVKELLSDRT